MQRLIRITKQVFGISLLISAISYTVDGQGRLLSPPGRSSLWRFGYGTPENYNDNALTCGSLQQRWEVNQGKCGVCGDPWDSKPRENEAGGQYAMEIISGVYKSGTLIEVIADVANANGGYFEFRLCANNNFTSAVKQECLNKGLLTLEDGISTRFENIHSGLNIVVLKLPDGVTCDQCVLQWKYRAADQYGCDSGPDSVKQCGFGRGEFQTEYFACADIAIYNDLSEQTSFQGPNGILDFMEFSQNKSSVVNKRSKRTTHNKMIPYERSAGIRFVPAFPSGMQLQFEPKTLRGNPKQPQVEWSWTLKGADGSVSPGRARRRTHNIPADIAIGNRHLNGLLSSTLNGGGRVRSSFNNRRSGPNNHFSPALNGFIVPEPSAIETSQAKVRAIIRSPIPNKATVQRISMPDSSFSVKTVTKTRQASRVLSLPKLQYNRNLPAHRSFLDPLAKKVSSQTQMVFARSNYRPTKQCQHCPFDQCLDDKLRIDHLFPGLFDSPTEFFECKRFERVFTIGNFDVVQNGLPSCQHPRFKRQINTFEDDEIGCCATRPQVILPLTVEAENDTFSVVQLGDAKKQFIVQGICGQKQSKGTTKSCTVCAAENNFQWVLVYDPRVERHPPVSFVPVKFPHYCRCYNYMALKG